MAFYKTWVAHNDVTQKVMINMTAKEKEIFLKAGFTQEQIEEVDEGMKQGLKVAIYANKNYLPIQMRQIRLGLAEHLPVEKYASIEYDWFQMEEIRKGLKAGVDTDIYASPEIPYEKMCQLRKGLEEGVNLYSYIQLKATVLRELRKARGSGVNILKYINEGYDADQLREIRHGLENGVDMDQYLSKEYRAASIAEIREGLQNGVDVSLYTMIFYSWRQMREIRLGLENRVEVDKYNNKLYSWDQMREIRLGLEEGLDVESYRLLRYTAGEMRRKRLAMMEVIWREQEEFLQSQIRSEDFIFDFGPEDLEAYITIQAIGKVITRDKLIDILEQNDIKKGILEDAVDRIVSGMCDAEKVLIAKGQAPTTGEEGWYEFLFRTDMEKKPKIMSDGSADYRNIEWFETVKVGQKLAIYHNATVGEDGYSVKGEVIKGRKGAEKRILTGKGFWIDQDKKTYVAAVDGMISLDDTEMNISNHLELDEVNMVTGNVQFNGSVHILGDVARGAVVKASGDVLIEGTVESATIESGGSIILKKGMNSADHGQIIAEKDVVSRFFESVKVTAKGNIEVHKCLNSQLYADGKVVSSGTISGGIAQAAKGFEVKHVGNQVGLHTILRLKLDEKVREESKLVKGAIRDIAKELQMLVHSYEEYKEKFPPEARSQMDIFAKIEKAVFTKKKQLEQFQQMDEELDQLLEKEREARIIIAGQAYEGTVVEMDGCRWEADNEWNILIKKNHYELEVLPNV